MNEVQTDHTLHDANEDRVLADVLRANLAALCTLLDAGDDDESRGRLFDTLKQVFDFDQAMIVAHESDGLRDGLRCLASSPASLIGRHWPDISFDDALDVQSLACDRGTQDAPHPLCALAAPGEAGLSFPVAAGDRAALMVMLRAGGDFGPGHAAIARQCATVALAMLAARQGDAREAEIARLNTLVAELRAAADKAGPDDAGLLKDIIDHLPISLTVQDDQGRFILANARAAANLATPIDKLIGASPADFLPEHDAASRREWERNLLAAGETVTTEGDVPDESGARTWLTAHAPVELSGRKLLMSSSVDITEQRHVERALAERAHIDELTGLPNRLVIESRVEAIIAMRGESARFALAFIDLDNFKHINDYYSHAVGDTLLTKIAGRVRKRLRAGDMLARISGDEFLLLLDPCDGGEDCKALVAEILNDLKQPFHIEAFEILTSASIGVSLYPAQGHDYERLRRNADSAMYRAKHAAKGDAVFFDAGMGRAITARMELEQRLRLAIRDRKFCCAFQPKVDIQTQEPVGFETLVRWRDEDGEIVPPGDFIGLAIELGLINPITHFVLEEAIAAIERLDAAFGDGTTISINVAAKQATDLEFMKSLTQSLAESGYAERIMLELTEDAFIAKGQFQTQVLPALREIGVKVSIDDFGTGYSSLSALADITADELKIDRSFISSIHERPRSQSVLRAIESLGRALGMSIVAEGVETFEELAYLHAATRIRYAQGFYFAKPFYLDEMTDRAATGREREEPRANDETRGMTGRVAGPARAG